RRCEPGADDADLVAVLVRLIGVHDARVAAKLVRERESRMPRCEEDVLELAATVAVDREAAVDGTDALDPSPNEPLCPAARDAELLDVGQEVFDRRVVAVDQARDERRHRPPSPRLAHREPRERRREAVAVALRAHVGLPDGRGAAAPGSAGIRLGREDRDLALVDAALAERQVAHEAGQPAADDRDPRHHFTEPASSPWTK